MESSGYSWRKKYHGLVALMEIEELRRIAAKEELSLNFVAKDEMISKALVQLQGHEDIILKGGTAINRIYIKNQRFSEDIDCDLLFSGSIQNAIKRTNEIAKKVQGFTVEKPRIMNHTIRYDLYYTNPLQHKDKIRLEFTPLSKTGKKNKKVVQFGYVPYETALLYVYDVEELIKNKINCIINRMEGKDFIDLFYLLDIPHNVLGLSQQQKEKVIGALSLHEKQIKSIANVINHYMPRTKRPNWHLLLQQLKEKIQKE